MAVELGMNRLANIEGIFVLEIVRPTDALSEEFPV